MTSFHYFYKEFLLNFRPRFYSKSKSATKSYRPANIGNVLILFKDIKVDSEFLCVKLHSRRSIKNT